MRSFLLGCVLLGSVMSWAARAADEPCKKFSSDLSHEAELMRGTPRPQAARPKAEDLPLLLVDTLYELDMVPQRKTTLAVKPEKGPTVSSPTAGLVGFKPLTAGRYRVSIASRHWVDLLDGKALVKPVTLESRDGCQRPYSAREYQLSANHEYSLQLSGAGSEQVLLTITAVQPPAK